MLERRSGLASVGLVSIKCFRNTTLGSIEKVVSWSELETRFYSPPLGPPGVGLGQGLGEGVAVAVFE